MRPALLAAEDGEIERDPLMNESSGVGESSSQTRVLSAFQVGELMSGQLALEKLLSDTLAQAMELLQADAGAIFVADETARQLVLASHAGMSSEFAAREARLPFGTCMCGHTVEAPDALFLVEDARQDPRCQIGSCLADGFLSLLCLPLRAGGRVWGLLRLHGRRRAAFDARESRLLAFIGSQLGLAIQRARLQEQIAQLLLRIEEERASFDSLMRGLVDGLVLVGDDEHIAYWNPSAERLLGIPAALAVGRPLSVIGHQVLAAAQDPAPAEEALRRAVEDVAACPQVEFSLEAPASCTIQARIFPLAGRGGFGIVLRDVTAERHLDEIKSQLLSTVSHELRTPLASIKGFASTLLRNDVEWDPAVQREFLQIIDQEADRLAELIANLLEMSRIEAGVLRIDREWMDLAPHLLEVVNEMRLKAAGRTFVLDVPEELPPVYADARRIRQVLHNLLENAAKYSTDGEIRVTVRLNDGEVRVSVSDRGMGIAPDQLQRVFDRFYRVDTPAARRAGGAGLGLSICKGMVEAHGGRIWAESTLGAGSTFHFTLPINGEDGKE